MIGLHRSSSMGPPGPPRKLLLLLIRLDACSGGSGAKSRESLREPNEPLRRKKLSLLIIKVTRLSTWRKRDILPPAQVSPVSPPQITLPFFAPCAQLLTHNLTSLSLHMTYPPFIFFSSTPFSSTVFSKSHCRIESTLPHTQRHLTHEEMVSRKRDRAEMESSEPITDTSMLDRLRNMWEFSNLMQYIFIFGKAVKIDEDLTIEVRFVTSNSQVLIMLAFSTHR